MGDFIRECFSIFGSFVTWAFSTPTGFGVSIGGLIVGIDVLAVIVYYLFSRYK